MKMCSVSSCERISYAAGMCSKHYNRLRSTGTTGDGPRARLSLEERFWRNIRKAGSAECWGWIGKSRLSGYGFIGLGGRSAGKALAHRVSWEIHNGQIPSGFGYHGAVIMHKCDNRLCVNPAHLTLGTQKENVLDMDMKGRRVSNPPRGSKHLNAKFTEVDILDIRASKRRTKELVLRYGVNRSTINGIRNGQTWRHVSTTV